MKSTSQIGAVFFCAESKIAVCSVSHRLGSFCHFYIGRRTWSASLGISPFGYPDVHRDTSATPPVRRLGSFRTKWVFGDGDEERYGIGMDFNDGQAITIYPGTKGHYARTKNRVAIIPRYQWRTVYTSRDREGAEESTVCDAPQRLGGFRA